MSVTSGNSCDRGWRLYIHFSEQNIKVHRELIIIMFDKLEK